MTVKQSEFAASFYPEGTRIKNFPALIFLCGGVFHEDEDHGNTVRHFFIHHLRRTHPLLAQKLVLAEDITNLFDDGLFTDLLQMEQLLANLATLVVLFVESAGSIAELGAFALLEPINQKLLVAIEASLFDARSFISLGPVRAVSKKRKDYCVAVPWFGPGTQVFDANTVKGALPDISDKIVETLQRESAETIFARSNDGHMMLLACQAVSLFTICTISELFQFLKSVHSQLTLKRAKQYIFILEHLKLIRRTKYIDTEYLVCREDPRYISYGFRPDTSTTDPLRWRSMIIEEYEKSTSKRLNALRNYEAQLVSTEAA